MAAASQRNNDQACVSISYRLYQKEPFEAAVKHTELGPRQLKAPPPKLILGRQEGGVVVC